MAGAFVDLLETLNELGFVIQILVFTYSLFWLYLTFRDMQLLFGLGATLVGYMIFYHGVSMTVLVSFFVFIVMFGMQIQQVLWFGLFPLLGYHIMGDRLAHSSEMDPMRMQQRMDTIQNSLEKGVGVSQGDMDFYQKHMGQQQMGMGGMPNQTQMMQMRIASGMSG